MISIGCAQRFDVTVTPALIELLTTIGITHYDSVCRQSVKYGGFIYGWQMRMHGLSEMDEPQIFVDGISNSKLQICLKILESEPLTLTGHQLEMRSQFSAIGLAALRQGDTDERFRTSIPVRVTS